MVARRRLERPRMRRREALLFAGKMGLSGLGAAFLGGCKGHTTPEPEPEPPPPPVSVSILVRFYNHTQGYIGERSYSGQSGTLIPIKAADCPDLSSVDRNRIAVREAFQNGWPGKLIEFSSSGQLSQAQFPRQDLVYDAFLMNKTNGADYNLIDSYPGYYGGMPHRPDATWWRSDDAGCPGPDTIPREALRQVQDALAFPWATYMSFREVQGNGNFFIGYKCPESDPGATWRGYAHDFGAWVNPVECAYRGYPLLRVFLEQIVKHLAGCIGPGEVAPSGFLTYQYVTNESGINAIGKDLLAYVPVKDARSTVV